jgi:hypothetical protein
MEIEAVSNNKLKKPYDEKLYKSEAQIDLIGEDEEDEESEIHLSLCGHLIALENGVQLKNLEEISEIFEEHKINFEEFSSNPH